MNEGIIINNWNLGGLADSKYQGIENSSAALVGLNLHGEPGIMKVGQRLVKESGTTVDEEVSTIVVCSNGNTYLFGKATGKIWSRTNAGVYGLEATDANGGILGAAEKDGYLYYASATKLGRWQIGAAWAARTDSWATFTNGDTGFHPMLVKNMVLYIGDKNYIAQVDANVFSANALDLEAQYRIKSLGEISTDLLIGTFINEYVNQVKIFRWNTTSVSFTNDDSVPEKSISAFIPLDNAVVVQAGRKGNIYTYNGEQLIQYTRIPGDWENTKEAVCRSAINYKGLPLFGVSNVSGNPCLEGVYSFGSYSASYPKILNLEYVISNGHLVGVDITAIANVGNDILVAWKDITAGVTTYGVDKVDWSNKYASAYFDTRITSPDRSKIKEFRIRAHYRSLPAGTSITISASVNNAAFAAVTTVNDTTRSLLEAVSKMPGAHTLQLRVAFGVSGNFAPELESLELIP